MKTNRNLGYRLHVPPPTRSHGPPGILKEGSREQWPSPPITLFKSTKSKLNQIAFWNERNLYWRVASRSFRVNHMGRNPFTVLQIPLAIQQSSRRGRNDGPMLMWE